MNFCVNCAWSTKSIGAVYLRCSLPGAVEPDIVTGHKVYPLCIESRRWQAKCGLDGKCWEPRPSFWQRLVARFKA